MRPAVLFFLVVILTQPVWSADTYLAPQYDLFVTHNSMFRSHIVVAGNWLTRESAFASAWAQYDIDIGIFSYFRRYLFKDPNPDKSKRISFRLGYLQVTDLKDDPNGFDEKRPLAEIVLRFPVGRAWLFDDRNRGEYRDVKGDISQRYRNRLRIERNILVRDIRVTPYTSGEIFYDGKVDRWSELQAALGIDFPWHNNTIVELEGMAQFVDHEYKTLSFTINVQKFL